MEKGILIAIGVGITIAIVIVISLTINRDNVTKIALNSTNLTPVSTPPRTQTPPPLTHGRNLSVNLTESVGVSAH